MVKVVTLCTLYYVTLNAIQKIYFFMHQWTSPLILDPYFRGLDILAFAFAWAWVDDLSI